MPSALSAMVSTCPALCLRTLTLWPLARGDGLSDGHALATLYYRDYGCTGDSLVVKQFASMKLSDENFNDVTSSYNCTLG
jgi:hypothetical protein